LLRNDLEPDGVMPVSPEDLFEDPPPIRAKEVEFKIAERLRRQ